MIKTSLRAKALACTFLAGAILAAAPAMAQSAQPAYRNLDSNGVDIVRGDYILAFTEGSIGSGPAELALLRQVTQNGQTSQWDQIAFQLSRPYAGGPETVSVALGNIAETFTGSAGSYTSSQRNGGSLTGSGASFTYTARDGTQISFSDPTGNPMSGATNFCKDTSQLSCTLLPDALTGPDGKTVGMVWTTNERCSRTFNDDGSLDCQYDRRLASVSNGYGYAIAFAYASSAGGNPPPASWYQRNSASFTNSAAGSGTQASVSYAYPSSGVVNITDTGGNVWQAGPGYIKRPGASSNTMQVTGTVGSSLTAVNAGVTTTYSRTVSGTTATMTITNALSQATTVVSDLNVGRPTSVTDPLSHTTSYAYDTYGRLTRVTAPEGNYVQTTYDARGNATQTDYVPKAGSGLATVTTTAAFPSSCSGNVACNQPTSTTDARGNTTTYSWDTTTGLLNSVTAPAPTSGAVAPQTRYTYSVGTDGVSQAVAISQCQTASSCAGTSDEVKTSIAYDFNGNVTSKTVAAGDNSLSATTAMTYDALGNLLTVDGPLSGTADTTRYRYNGARQVVGVVSPDPDGAGALKNRAVRNTYTNALLTKVEQGTVNSQSDTDWAAFASLQETDASYDANARPVTKTKVAGGTTYALTQASYDALGRVQCSATRMNPAAFGSLPSSACTLGTASTTYGNDRITKVTYDNAGRSSLVQTGYGVTGTQADEVATTYTNNGRTASVTDAEGNKTSYVYDGLDRLSQTLYPSGTKGAGTSNSADYEQLTYDSGGNITSRRLRDGNSIGYTFDALGRLTYKDLPGTEPDVTYAYDALSRMTSAATSSQTLSFTYDALGRNVTQVGPQGTLTSAWDIAGRRTRITHPDGFYVDQDYLVTGEVAHIRENGATSGAGVLATYAYDDLGRRSSITRGDGSTTGYTYDNVSRLTQLAEDLAGTSYDQTLGFSYSPAGQITSSTRSNDNYAWTGHYNVNRGYTANGLNQYTASGSVTPTYDTKGNLTSAGSTTYGYSSENLLTSATAGITLSYDPAMRLYQTAGGTPGTTRFAYDGPSLIAEYNGSNALQRRFVHGPSTDEPVAWYEGSGITDRRFLHQDERGSVVAVTNSAGTVLNINTYDEYGIPRSNNVGRFQYTGQAWLPELGLYHYKARVYSPTLGRFLQTDPIGYGDGMNLFGYVHSDPINFSDPRGMDEEPGELGKPTDPPSLKKPRTVCVPIPGSRHVVCGPLLDFNHDGKIDGKDAAAITNTINGIMQVGLESVLDDMRKELADRTHTVAVTCGNHQFSTECQEAKDARMEVFNAYNQLTPLPGPMQFETIRPSFWEYVWGIGGCGLALSPGRFVATAIGAGGCGTFIGDLAIPKQRRK